MKRYLGYILLFIFSFQYLPVKAAVKILKGQSMEQVQDCDDCDNDLPVKEKKDDLNKEFLSLHYIQPTIANSNILVAAFHRYQHYFQQHAPDTITPPPDFR
ncbi:MAG: hypothetical protein JSS96_03730 [Bacteroidetes bacterium]|nr:hypothetical protein [Bacteroidota bacterium]